MKLPRRVHDPLRPTCMVALHSGNLLHPQNNDESLREVRNRIFTPSPHEGQVGVV